MSERMKANTIKFPSASKANKVYETVIWSDGSVSCNCPAWIFNNKRTCKHVLAIGQSVVNLSTVAPPTKTEQAVERWLLVGDVTLRKNDWREATKKARLYVHPKGESVLENLLGPTGRRGRPITEWRRDVLPVVVEALRAKGFLPADAVATARWSQYAGCSCPCSPGFIFDAPQLRGFEVWADVSTPAGLAELARKDAEKTADATEWAQVPMMA